MASQPDGVTGSVWEDMSKEKARGLNPRRFGCLVKLWAILQEFDCVVSENNNVSK